jgi:hypothetical protein
MKACSVASRGGAAAKSHNLNINMYSFKELLELFQLDYKISIEDLKRAKMMVLKMHPDKSRLPADYFLFYKKAFDIVVQYYNESVKTTAEVPTTEQKYIPETSDKRVSKTVNKAMNDMGQDRFQQTFNQLFEENMKKPVRADQNDWFKNNDPLYQFDTIASVSGLAGAVESIKKTNAALVRYNGVENMNSGGPSYGNLYDEDEGEASDRYVTCDPFSKLKFDDLRKVHKDQTVLAVSETDFANMKTYGSIDQLQRDRGAMQIQHVDRSESERILDQREQVLRQQMLAKQHAANLRSMEYAEKNKSVMASFLKLTN